MTTFRRTAQLLLLLVILPLCRANDDELALGTSVSPPYHFPQGGVITGSVVDLMTCALQQHDWPFSLDIYPWKRALQLLANNDLDIIYSVENLQKDDAPFVASVPLVLEKWFWYSKDRDFPRLSDRIAVVRGSNQENWLEQQGFTALEQTHAIESAFKMLIFDRVDFVLADENQVSFLAQLQRVELDNLQKWFTRFSTLSALFSPALSDRHPDMIADLNAAVLHCGPIGLQLDPTTLQLLRAVETNVQLKIASAEVAAYINSLNLPDEPPDSLTIQDADERWMRSTEASPDPLVTTTLNNILAKRLRAIQNNSDGLISEIIVTDEYGRTIAASQKTTDYWQGDEDPVQNVRRSPKTGYIRPIYFDASTGQFQTQIGIALEHELKLNAIAIIGINLEQAFLQYQ